ncbi:hypothetical protein MUO14_22440 [Halobacillus shinanisalinarum]|uniref:Uncharacterized protein n=1 Tax=Halobacillus shinanisalinarum TaxID=2932258 RepID=A0ABY4GY43_9BACI|nr:hypothetical protein [Halobacillus shinanisalinarum]UOQ93116.1 hypothetical protein MUO14_22440 [Halobacillus shinanisalinarum]
MPDIAVIFLFLLIPVLLLSFYVKIWIRLIVAAYYCCVFFMFSRGYNQLMSKRNAYVENNGYNPDKQEDIRALKQFWDEKTAFIDNYLGLVILPLLVFIVYSYYKWFVHLEERKHKVLLLLSAIPVGIIFFIYLLFFSMLGYQP